MPAGALALSAQHHFMPGAMAHLALVATAGALTGAAALGMSLFAARRNDGRAVLLGLAFSVMAMMLTVHALATPGVLVGPNGLVQFAGALNLPVGGAILACTALPALRRPQRTRRLLALHIAAVAGLALAGAAALLVAHIVPPLPTAGSRAAHLVFLAGAAALALPAWRAGRTFLLTRRTSDLLVCAGVVWLIGAQFGLLHFDGMSAAFWTAHGLEVAGLGLIGIPAALDLRHGAASRPLVGDLRPVDLVDHEEAFLGGRVRALMVRLAEKDPSTAGHTRRVATLAVRLGHELGLPESRLRRLALGGLLHDMGKLAVPDEILTKPAALTDEEFAVIRRHPTWGRELLDELGGFPTLVLELVESHHERLDGAGYPAGRLAAQLPLEVRILTVADVFDALTADRVYREAWTPARALEVIGADAGSAFDPRCVQALKALVAADARAEAPGWQLTFAASPPPVRPPQPRIV